MTSVSNYQLRESCAKRNKRKDIKNIRRENWLHPADLKIIRNEKSFKFTSTHTKVN